MYVTHRIGVRHKAVCESKQDDPAGSELLVSSPQANWQAGYRKYIAAAEMSGSASQQHNIHLAANRVPSPARTPPSPRCDFLLLRPAIRETLKLATLRSLRSPLLANCMTCRLTAAVWRCFVSGVPSPTHPSYISYDVLQLLICKARGHLLFFYGEPSSPPRPSSAHVRAGQRKLRRASPLYFANRVGPQENVEVD